MDHPRLLQENRCRSPPPQETISDPFVNVPKLPARLRCIFGQPVNCYWRMGEWHIDNAPRALKEVSLSFASLHDPPADHDTEGKGKLATIDALRHMFLSIRSVLILNWRDQAPTCKPCLCWSWAITSQHMFDGRPGTSRLQCIDHADLAWNVGQGCSL